MSKVKQILPLHASALLSGLSKATGMSLTSCINVERAFNLLDYTDTAPILPTQWEDIVVIRHRMAVMRGMVDKESRANLFLDSVEEQGPGFYIVSDALIKGADSLFLVGLYDKEENNVEDNINSWLKRLKVLDFLHRETEDSFIITSALKNFHSN